MSFLDSWWEEQRKTPSLPENDYPATFGYSGGETIHPWSARLGALTRLKVIIDFNITAASIRKAWHEAQKQATKAAES